MRTVLFHTKLPPVEQAGTAVKWMIFHVENPSERKDFLAGSLIGLVRGAKVGTTTEIAE